MYNHSGLKEKIEQALLNLSLDSETAHLTEPVSYILSIGGKRLRPVMVLMACNMYSDTVEDAVMPAAGIEVFHNFTLVHDDIMDQAPVRRNSPTVHQKWNVNQAILSGDVMAFIANECFIQTPPDKFLRVFSVFNRAAIDVCKGQQLDMDFENAASVSQEEYLRMIELKTAALIAASLKIGAVIGKADEKDSDLLYGFGRNLGMAFQIQDDLLDIWGDAHVFGKAQAGDIVANKKTFPLIKAFEVASAHQLNLLREQFSLKDPDPGEKVKTVTGILDDLGIKKITESLANKYIDRAFSLLRKVTVDEQRKKELVYIASSLIGRDR